MKTVDIAKGYANSLSGTEAVAALNQRWAQPAAADFADDLEVMNYALLLEHLEAEFYRQGNSAGLLRRDEAECLFRVQADEEFHVGFLTLAIQRAGGKPVAAPQVDFGDSFKDRTSYLTTSHVFENVGVGAYLGAAGFIKDKGVLQSAAGIFGVEARHAAVVGDILGLPAEGGVYMGAVETPKTKSEVLAAVAPFLP